MVELDYKVVQETVNGLVRSCRNSSRFLNAYARKCGVENPPLPEDEAFWDVVKDVYKYEIMNRGRYEKVHN